MEKTLWVIIIALLFTSISSEFNDNAVFKAQWNVSRGTGDAIRIDTTNAIRGKTGLLISHGDFKVLYNRFPFLDNHWIRYYLRIDNTSKEKKAILHKPIEGFISLNFSDRLRKDRPHWIYRYDLESSQNKKGDIILSALIRPATDKKSHITFKTSLSFNKTYCIESHFSFRSNDTLSITEYIDGDSLFNYDIGYFDSKSLIEIGASSFDSTNNIVNINIAELSVSKERLPPIPPTPVNFSVVLTDSFTALMKCSLEIDSSSYSYKTERHIATRWRIKNLYDAEELDPKDFFRKESPFALDSGSYVCQAAFKNSFDTWGEWSKACTLRVDRQRFTPIELKECYITEPGKTAKLSEIERGKNYQFHFIINPVKGWIDVAYLLGAITSDKYTFGHPANTFGSYLKKSNYILNISFEGDTVTPDIIHYYEKAENTAISGRVFDNGIKAAYTVRNLILDTLSGHVATGFQISNEADTGKWAISAFAMAAVGKIRSNLLRKEISLVNKKPLKGFVRTFTSIIVILTSIASMIFVFWRKRSPQIQPVKTDEKKEKDPLFSAIDNFIDNHISEDISTDRILKDLRLSSYSFYRVLKNNGIQSLPKLLNIKRVEKAKKLLLETEKSISEIGYETGFGEARYFNKVFKDHTSLTPGEFRKKR